MIGSIEQPIAFISDFLPTNFSSRRQHKLAKRREESKILVSDHSRARNTEKLEKITCNNIIALTHRRNNSSWTAVQSNLSERAFVHVSQSWTGEINSIGAKRQSTP